ncbi:unnamed protein product [Arabidopsis thaliana]|uniref:(thale cress) hypothetical protein n=1 Tax=Arabidopsis thaliana TaxID=3702 RepID=A0A7G2EYE9_ARATH|nr:unnamed protein product [Arabidopsis thaliana]
MKISKSLWTVMISILFYLTSTPQFVICSSLEVTIDNHSPSNLKTKGSLEQDKLSHQMINSIKLHGILLWVSMGFLMPVGILFIRMANKAHENGIKVKVFFYLHVIFQILAVVLATIGAILSLRTLENSFDNNHQRLGLALYAAMWLQFLTGVFKPSRGSKRRLRWFLLHWILGTIVSIVGIINIYTGIRAYQKKTSLSRDSSLWTILFTVQVTCLVFFYLYQDKWEHFQKQRVVLDELDHQNNNTNGRNNQSIQVVTRNDHEQKVMVPQPCRKRWLTESSIMPKKHRAIEGVGPSSIMELKAQLYKSQEEAKQTKDFTGSDAQYHRAKERIAAKDSFAAKNSGVESRNLKDKLEHKAVKDGAVNYAALEKKAQLYDKLVRGELSDEEGEEKYCVDFLRKGIQHEDPKPSSTYNNSISAPPEDLKQDGEDDGSLFSTKFAGLGHAIGTADVGQHVRIVREVHEEVNQAREKATELKQRRQEQATNRREKLKQAYLRKQLEKLKAQQQQQQDEQKT